MRNSTRLDLRVLPRRGHHLPGLYIFGAPFEITRINLVQFLATAVLVILLIVGTRRMKVVPGRFQSVVEMGLDFVRVNIAEDILGRKDGKRFLPILTTIFFMVLFMNITGVIPGLNIAGTSVIAVPMLLAIVAYVTFIYAGIKKSPGGFFKNALLPWACRGRCTSSSSRSSSSRPSSSAPSP